MALLAGAFLTAGAAWANEGGARLTPDEALKRLMDGNQRYAANKLANTTVGDPAVRSANAKSQKPYAVILTCSDSRVAPEIIFDKGLGEIFVVRVAGNIADPIVLGSIEYAAEHLSSPLIMVLGHERCGAVTAAVEACGKTTGSANIDAILKKIDPCVKMTGDQAGRPMEKNACSPSMKAEFVESVIDTNAKAVAKEAINQSNVLKQLVAEKKIKIVAAKYDLDDGKVTLFD